MDITREPVPYLSERDRVHVALQSDSLFRVEFYSQHIGYEGPISGPVRQVIARFPEKKRVKSHTSRMTYEMPITDNTVDILHLNYPGDKATWEEDARIAAEYILVNKKVSERNAKLIAQFREDAENVEVPPLEVNKDLPLAKYQEIALACASTSEGYGLFMEQGTGKTPVAIARICNEVKDLDPEKDGLYRVIVVCPNNVRMNWVKEIEKFATQPGKAQVLRGGPLKRIKQFVNAMRRTDDSKFSTVICSYETLTNMWPQLRNVTWDLAILDESHFIKSPKAKRSKTAMELRDQSVKRMVLTGTPITNSAIDLYNQFEFMQQGGSGFSTFENFRSFYGVYIKNEDGHRKLIGMQNLPFMKERLARMAFVVRKKEVMKDLPPKQFNVLEVEMTPEQRRIYKDVSSHMLAEIEAMESDSSMPKQLMVSNILTKLLRLAEITSGYVRYDGVYSDDGEELRPPSYQDFSPNPKVDILLEELDGRDETSKTIVWACFTRNITAISDALSARGIDHVKFTGSTSFNDRVEAERRFNEDSNCKVFLGNPAAGGTGLNLLGYPPGHPEAANTNCDHVVYFSQNWSSTARSQSEDRSHRRGTRVPITITDLCVAGTIDEEIRTRVTDKRLHALEVSDVRNILKSLLED